MAITISVANVRFHGALYGDVDEAVTPDQFIAVLNTATQEELKQLAAGDAVAQSLFGRLFMAWYETGVSHQRYYEVYDDVCFVSTHVSMDVAVMTITPEITAEFVRLAQELLAGAEQDEEDDDGDA